MQRSHPFKKAAQQTRAAESGYILVEPVTSLNLLPREYSSRLNPKLALGRPIVRVSANSAVAMVLVGPDQDALAVNFSSI